MRLHRLDQFSHKQLDETGSSAGPVCRYTICGGMYLKVILGIRRAIAVPTEAGFRHAGESSQQDRQHSQPLNPFHRHLKSPSGRIRIGPVPWHNGIEALLG